MDDADRWEFLLDPYDRTDIETREVPCVVCDEAGYVGDDDCRGCDGMGFTVELKR